MYYEVLNNTIIYRTTQLLYKIPSCPSVLRGRYKCAAANSKGTSLRQLLPANAIPSSYVPQAIYEYQLNAARALKVITLRVLGGGAGYSPTAHAHVS